MTKEAIDKVLKEIQLSVPEALRKAVVVRSPATPVMKMIVDKALEDPEFPEEKKQQLRELKDAGYFEKEHLGENPKIANQIENYVNREIKKAVKEGRLPNKKQLIELTKLWSD